MVVISDEALAKAGRLIGFFTRSYYITCWKGTAFSQDIVSINTRLFSSPVLKGTGFSPYKYTRENTGF